MKGSVTIEASFIYPMVLIFMLFTILYNFYAHDKISTKSNAYTHMIKSYFNEDNYDQKTFENSLDNFCFLSNNYTCSYNQISKTLYLKDKYDHIFNVSFSSYERCKFIREYYCLIMQIISQNSGKE